MSAMNGVHENAKYTLLPVSEGDWEELKSASKSPVLIYKVKKAQEAKQDGALAENYLTREHKIN